MAAYGRLDVYWPSGPIESYQLDKPTVAIGRSTGNDIALDTTAVSRYHISVSLRGETVVLEDLDSVNGTYIDGARVPPHQPHVLRDGEEIQIGDIRLIFHTVGRRATSETKELQTVESDQPTFKVEVEDTDQAVTPGAHSQTMINVQNVGEEMDHFTIQVEGVPKEWVRLDRSEMELPPGVRTQIILSFRPIRQSTSKPGEYPVTIRVRSEQHPDSSIEVPFKLHLLAYGGFGIVLGTPRLEAGKALEIYVQNQGSGPLPLTLRGTDPGNNFDYDLQPSSLTLAPGEKRTIRGTIRPKKRRYIGTPRELRFDVIAQSRDKSAFQAPVSGVYLEKTGFPLWMILAPVAGIAALIVLAVGALVVIPALQSTLTPTPSSTPSPAPTITPVVVIFPTFTPFVTETTTPIPETSTQTATLVLVPPITQTTATETTQPSATTSPTPTSVPILALTESRTPTATETASPTPTASATPSATRSVTPSASATNQPVGNTF